MQFKTRCFQSCPTSLKACRPDRVVGAVELASRRPSRQCSAASRKLTSVRRLQYAFARLALPQAVKNAAVLGHGSGSAVLGVLYSDVPPGPDSSASATVSARRQSKVSHGFSDQAEAHKVSLFLPKSFVALCRAKITSGDSASEGNAKHVSKQVWCNLHILAQAHMMVTWQSELE